MRLLKDILVAAKHTRTYSTSVFLSSTCLNHVFKVCLNDEGVALERHTSLAILHFSVECAFM